ncbi:MAG: hypothetical protein QNJ36_10175 [Calothrix sp. MO_167.B42]|nr:hypothetical protein [Calothrix sp. MO_167.B42]
MKKALQWWHSRQSMRLFREAESIRDGLLQESFIIRRDLEILSRDNVEIPQEYLMKIDGWHQSLVKLSDRLFPECLPHHLPLAIEFLLVKWLESYPHVKFDILLPTSWPVEEAECSLVILTALDESLRIAMSHNSEPTLIYIRLQLQTNINTLVINICYDNIVLICHSFLTEVFHLGESFKLLTSGQYFFQIKKHSISYSFCWESISLHL